MIGHKNNKTKGTNNAPIPEDNEQYCFRMPLKLEVHKRYRTTRNRSPNAREAKSRQKQLKSLGKGNKPKEASSLTQKEIDYLYNKGGKGFHLHKHLYKTLCGSTTVYTLDYAEGKIILFRCFVGFPSSFCGISEEL